MTSYCDGVDIIRISIYFDQRKNANSSPETETEVIIIIIMHDERIIINISRTEYYE